MSPIRVQIERLDELGDRLLAGRSQWAVVALVFLAGMALCGWYSVRLGAFVSWDLKNYQYYAPYALLTGRFTFDLAAAQIQTFLNPLPFVPFYLAVSSLKPVVAGFVMGAFHGLSTGLLFLVCLEALHAIRPGRRLVLALVATALGAWGPTYLGMMGGSGSDNVTLIFVLAGLLGLLRGWRTDQNLPRLLGAVSIGVAAGLKLVAAVFVVGGVVATLVVARGIRGRAVAAGWFSLAAFGGLLLSRGLWMWHLWSYWESPLFPFFNSTFRSRFFHQLDFADVRYLPPSLADHLTFPFAFFTDPQVMKFQHEFRDMRYAVVYVLVALLALVVVALRARRSNYPLPDRTTSFLLVFFVVSYLLWQVKFAIMRYIVPLELLAPVLILLMVRWLVPEWRAATGITLASFVAIALVMQPRTTPREEWGDRYLDVTAPTLDDPASTIVVIGNTRPWSYLIPFFPPEVRFVGAWNRFSRPEDGERHQGQRRMLDVINQHEGPMYLLSTPHEMPTAFQHLPWYGPDKRDRRRHQIRSSHERVDLFLTRIRKR